MIVNKIFMKKIVQPSVKPITFLLCSYDETDFLAMEWAGMCIVEVRHIMSIEML